MMRPKFLICVVGPTGVGKTSATVFLAKEFNVPVISADSRQFYRQLNIGTSKPPPEEMERVPHFFIDNLDIGDYYSAGLFETDVLNFLTDYFRKEDLVFMTGGSGLYIDAVCNGIDEIPGPDKEIRNRLQSEYKILGLKGLLKRLEISDPDFFDTVDRHNPARILRALEVIELTGNKYSELRNKKRKERPFRIIKIGLELPRDKLYSQINTRVDKMMNDGLLDEARMLYPYRHAVALQTVGYKELFEYLDGKTELKEAVRLIKRNTRRYAKRQISWFHRDASITWFHHVDRTGMKEFITGKFINIIKN